MISLLLLHRRNADTALVGTAMNQYKSRVSAPNGFGVGETIHISKPLKYESCWWRLRAWYLIDIKPFLVSGDRWMQFIARRLPRRLCHWAFIRVWGWNCWNEDMDPALFSRILDAWDREYLWRPKP